MEDKANHEFQKTYITFTTFPSLAISKMYKIIIDQQRLLFTNITSKMHFSNKLELFLLSNRHLLNL